MDCIIEQVFSFCFYAIHLPPAEEGEFLLYYVKGLMEDNEYKEMIADNIILELNDDAPESKLLGIQIDIDLEDKDKSSVDMK